MNKGKPSQGMAGYRIILLQCFAGWLFWVIPAAMAQEQHPYEAASSGFFREQDTLPGAYNLYQQDKAHRGWQGLGPGGGDIKRSSFSLDVHANLAQYNKRSCVNCHEVQRYSLHTSRGNVSCAQCHRAQPIVGIQHYYSPMNPIRRHAYVCAKCHEGATPSFASYVIHEPRPLASSTAQSFPLLYYSVWFMVILAGGVFVIFLPYVTLWGIRELIDIIAKGKPHG